MISYVLDNGIFKRKKVDFPFTEIAYDDVVDYSQFSPSAEKNETRIASISGGGTGRGVYDDPDSLPDDLVVRVRSGKLDRTEVALALKSYQEKIKNEAEEKLKAESDKKSLEIAKARQEFLDRKTGFTGVPQTDLNN